MFWDYCHFQQYPTDSKGQIHVTLQAEIFYELRESQAQKPDDKKYTVAENIVSALSEVLQNASKDKQVRYMHTDCQVDICEERMVMESIKNNLLDRTTMAYYLATGL